MNCVDSPFQGLLQEVLASESKSVAGPKLWGIYAGEYQTYHP